MALEANINELTMALAIEKSLKGKYENMGELLEKEKHLREKTEQKYRLIEQELKESGACWKSEVSIFSHFL